MILRTDISVNQLSIYGAVADLTDITNANATSQNSTSLAQGDLLQEYERIFAELPDDQKLSKPCSDAGFLKEIGNGQLTLLYD